MLYCYNDKHSGWGAKLHELAKQRGMRSKMLVSHEQLPLSLQESALFFCRVEQFPPAHEPSKKFCLDVLAEPCIRGIQTMKEVCYYERKDLQALDAEYRDFMPETYVLRAEEDGFPLNDRQYLTEVIRRLGLPIVSKAAFGSSSSNVRVLRTHEACYEDAAACLAGTDTPKRGTQKGYVIWQKFLRGNDFVYRVNRIGERYNWALRVFNRPATSLASGSGVYEPVTQFNTDALLALHAACKFFAAVNTKWCGIDLAYDYDAREWRVLESTLAWNMTAPGANLACPFVDEMGRPHDKGYHGRDTWKLLLDEVQAGVYGEA